MAKLTTVLYENSKFSKIPLESRQGIVGVLFTGILFNSYSMKVSQPVSQVSERTARVDHYSTVVGGQIGDRRAGEVNLAVRVN